MKDNFDVFFRRKPALMLVSLKFAPNVEERSETNPKSFDLWLKSVE